MTRSENSTTRSIKSKVSIVLMLVLTLILAGFAGFNAFQLRSNMNDELNLTAEITVKRLAGQLAAPLWSIDEDLIGQIIDAEMLQKLVEGVLIRDLDDESILLGKRRDANGGVQKTTTEIDKANVVAKRTIRNADGRNFAQVEVYFTSAPLEKKFNQALVNNVITIVVLNVAILVAVYFTLKRILIQPIAQLTVVAERMSKGELTAKIAINTNDEIEQLARTLERMRVSLLYAIRKLKSKQ
jgi:methyl-accepting chemotaxis protein